MTIARTAFVLAIVCASATSAVAQGRRPAPRSNRITVSAGLVTSGGYPIGERNAELRRNVPGAPTPLTFFRTEADIERAAGFEGRVGIAVTRRFTIEAGVSVARPRLVITIAADNEVTGAAEVSEKVSQLALDVSGVFQLPWSDRGRRTRPYVMGGAGYLRQLHEDRLLAEAGRTIHVGGGLAYWLRGADGRLRPMGVRGDARYVRRFNAIDFEESSRGYPTVSVLGFVVF